MNPGQREQRVRMLLLDRARLVVLMRLAGVTARQLAVAAGWSSHSYATRLLRGEVSTVGAGAAVRIAERLGVGVDDLFASEATTIAGRADVRSGS